MWRLLLPLLAGCDILFEVSPIKDTDASGSSYDDGLVAHYRLDTLTSDSTTPDELGGADAVCGAACPTPVEDGPGSGERSLAFEPSGMPEVLTIPGSMRTDLVPAFTVVVWLKVTTSGGGGCPFSQTYGSTSDNAWQICISEVGETQFYSPVDFLYKDDDERVGQWQQLAIAKDALNTYLFLDGELVESQPAKGPVVADHGTTILGGDFDNGEIVHPSSAVLHDLRMYRRVLDFSEIRALFQLR